MTICVPAAIASRVRPTRCFVFQLISMYGFYVRHWEDVAKDEAMKSALRKEDVRRGVEHVANEIENTIRAVKAYCSGSRNDAERSMEMFVHLRDNELKDIKASLPERRDFLEAKKAVSTAEHRIWEQGEAGLARLLREFEEEDLKELEALYDRVVILLNQ